MQEKIIIVPWGEPNNEYLNSKFFDPKFPLTMVSPSVISKKREYTFDDFADVVDFSLIYQYLVRTAEHFRTKKFSAVLLEKHYKYANLNENNIINEIDGFRTLKFNFDEIYNYEYKRIPDRLFFFLVVDPMFDLKNPILRVLIIAETDMETLQSQIFSDTFPLNGFYPYNMQRIEIFPFFPYESLTKISDNPDMLKKMLFFMIRSRPFRFGRMIVSYSKNKFPCFWSEFAREYHPFGEPEEEFRLSLVPYVDINRNWPRGSPEYSYAELLKCSYFELGYEEF